MLNRREFLQSGLALTAFGAAGPGLRAEAGPVDELSIEIGEPIAAIPNDFIGLGYEMSSAAKIGLLSANNQPYVELLRNLGPSGVLRVGGIVADFTSYSAHAEAKAEPKDTVITPESLRQLRGFLDVIGWTAIWSVNFGRGTLEDSIAEAKDVSRILGLRLNCIELGNEVENYSRGERPLRPPPYSYATYRAEYTRWRAAMLEAVPTLRFAAPDTAASVEWVERMASDAHGDVQLLTTHYYRGDQKLGTQDQLMRPDPALLDRLERLQHASRQSGIPWRMCETNSFFGGGRPGVSDTLAGALWALDFMLLLAQYGCAGVNIETGVNQLGLVSSYSPVQDDGAGHNTAGAPYYGMLAFTAATAGTSTMLAVKAAARGSTVYALGHGKQVSKIVVINKGTAKSARVSLQHPALRNASVLRLTGPSLESKTGIAFGGSAAEATGHWTPKPQPLLTNSIVVPPASAVLLKLHLAQPD